MFKLSFIPCFFLFLSVVLIPQPSFAEDIVIGVIGGLTGAGASYGKGIVQGAQMAVDEINAEGGINNKKIVLKIVDDTSEPARSALAMRRLISSSPNVIVGGWGSSQVLSHMDFAEQSAIPYIVVGATSPHITTQLNKWIFRVIPSDKVIVEALAEYLVKQGKRSIAIIHDRNAYGSASRDIFNIALSNHGIKPTVIQSYGTSDQVFQRQLTIINQNNPDSLVIFGTVPAAPLIIKQARAMEIMVPFFGTGGLANNRLIKQAPAASEGTMLISFYHSELNEDVRQWHSRYLERYADIQNPNPGNAIFEYSAIRHIVAPCLRKNESSHVALRNCIANWKGKFTGATGELFFNADGQLGTAPIPIRINRGAFQLISNELP
ncbi:MAG: ABC transporter substrate-binding protein [Gammaproteobacteria bacterium]|nr:ABC transporter substrate-binding protein [Gammaproteobacteria bacterium]